MPHLKQYKYLDIITITFVVVLIITNLVGSMKVTKLCVGWGDEPFCFSCTTGLLLFPVSYLIGDILTEIYGYSTSRRIIWTGFTALLISNLIIQFFIFLPPDPNWGLQDEYAKIFNQSFRVSMASMVAFWCGEFTNSYVLAKMKILTKGKFMIARLIGSTVAGELVDTLIIFPLGFLGAEGYPLSLMLQMMTSKYIIKVLWEIIAYPLVTVHLIKFLKKSENEDHYDYDTDLNPFHSKPAVVVTET